MKRIKMTAVEPKSVDEITLKIDTEKREDAIEMVMSKYQADLKLLSQIFGKALPAEMTRSEEWDELSFHAIHEPTRAHVKITVERV
jgi:hypothetical protein